MNHPPHHGGGPNFDRDRERDREREREIDDRHRRQQQEEMAHREREREREDNERRRDPAFQSGGPLQHATAGPLNLHQPTPARVTAAIHSPGGLLANHGGPPPAMPLGAPPGPPTQFGGPLQPEPNRQMPLGNAQGGPPGGQHPHMFPPMSHGSAPPPSGSLGPAGAGAPFGASLQEAARAGGPTPLGSAMPAAASLAGNQQPILNDALSYLDQVKVQFHDKPEVYNRFLDIMKDFKSQAIDTPGVIERVSNLFAGHPSLIQGFNTFLPPGYRIECGVDNPNSIRVTTPSGTTMTNVGNSKNIQMEVHPPQAGPGQVFARGNNWPTIQNSVESPEAVFSVPLAQNGTAAPFGSAGGPGGHGPQNAPFDNLSPVQQRAVPHSSQGGGPPGQRNAQSPSAGQAGINGSAAQQASLEKRGPVEFNHAISYVNKIKNRFQDTPEIYKHFLEILQTYQREQKPIQEVYAQVTTLFGSAPDLLEDFKQFLPESAAQNRQSGRQSDEGLTMSALTQSTAASAARDGPKMPPVGNFAPPTTTGKEGGKKRSRPSDKQAQSTSAQQDAGVSSVRSTLPASAPNAKRSKLSHRAADGPAIEPTLTPVMPEPLPPSQLHIVDTESWVLFDRIKKFLNNRSIYHEFIKFVNLYNQELVDKPYLVSKIGGFIGGNPELFKQFKDLVGYVPDDEVIDNLPAPPTEKISLSNCRGYGPSYRLIPKRERLKQCSGRDELCNSVLNDEWASHPTWASEDSGFVAHRKNTFEEALHRIEEERHDYDFYIEAAQRCIQLLEPVAQQMLTMAPEERKAFRLSNALGGPSMSIYKRVFKKIYGIDKGASVVNSMFETPFNTLPVLLARLKQKDEEWRFIQRNWEAVWLTNTENIFLKSLDHMGIHVKTSDKRTLSAKHLVDSIKTTHESQRRTRLYHKEKQVSRYQFEWSFSDEDIVLDLLRFMVSYAHHSGIHTHPERERILEFFEAFIPQFFDLSEDQVQQRLSDIVVAQSEEDEEEQAPAEATASRSSRRTKKSDLLRGVLDPGRNGSKSRTTKEGSASGSKETTPDIGSANEEEMPDASEDTTVLEVSNDRWLPKDPVAASIISNVTESHGDLKADASFQRDWYNFFCNQTVYVFFSVFHTLYQRLKDVKDSKDSVLDEIRRETVSKPGRDLDMIHDEMHHFDKNPESFWPTTVQLIDEYISGLSSASPSVDETKFQDVLRHYYLKNGWKLYSIHDLLKILCRQALVCNSPDAKEKTGDLIQRFLDSRQNEETNYQAEINARKFAEKCVKDGELFCIRWYPNIKEAAVRWLPKEETTFHLENLDREQRWQYYVSSYMQIEPTEGVDRTRVGKSVLARNLPSASDGDSDSGEARRSIHYHEGLTLMIDMATSQITYEKGTSECHIYGSNQTRSAGADNSAEGATDAPAVKDASAAATEAAKREELTKRRAELHAQRLKEKMIMNQPWMKDLNRDDVQKKTDELRKFVDEGVVPGTVVAGAD